jgi:hypothetical protein
MAGWASNVTPQFWSQILSDGVEGAVCDTDAEELDWTRFELGHVGL